MDADVSVECCPILQNSNLTAVWVAIGAAPRSYTAVKPRGAVCAGVNKLAE